ncbi:MAG: type I DNA topoisomerase [Clostridia bacterium]|nr:type I DNA topoisomerase [Clostridia bacterium]
MPYKLVIVESPAKAHTISKFLGKGYHVEASNGHVRDLPKSQIGVDEETGFEPKYITIRGRGEILNRIRKEAHKATEILLATDPDREGEAISWHLENILKIPEDACCRVEFHEITKREVESAIKSSRPVNMNLVNAQQARRVLDRLVGYKISPILWSKVHKGLSAGRVQSVATAMICAREKEVLQFIPEEYWTIEAVFKSENISYKAKLHQVDGAKAEVKDGDTANELVTRIQSESYKVAQVRLGEKKKHPAAPFTTSNLQQEASRKLGFTALKTMQIAQQLYEGIDISGEGTQGLVTYIRTDSTRISDEALQSVREMIASVYSPDYLPETPNVYKTKKSAQDAHEAIRPTNLAYRPDDIKSSLSKDQYKLYKLVYNRFVASQMASAVYDTISADIAGETTVFRCSGQRMKFPGFTAVYEEVLDDQQDEDDISIPKLTEGMDANLESIDPEQHFTQPPARFTEASLVRELEEKGIGRPSTYAPTISTILNRGYITREKKRLFPTELGIIVNDIMLKNFPDIVNETFTADMERQLDEVEAGTREWHELISEFYGPFKQTLEEAEKTIEKVSIEDQVSDVQCEKCGAMMVYKMGRYGKFLACPNFPECRNTVAIQKEIGVPCPECGKRILERMSRKGRKFYGCEGYPDCKFVSWEMPVNEKCEKCGGNMVLKRGRKGETYHVCTNEQCRFRKQVDTEADN